MSHSRQFVDLWSSCEPQTLVLHFYIYTWLFHHWFGNLCSVKGVSQLMLPFEQSRLQILCQCESPFCLLDLLFLEIKKEVLLYGVPLQAFPSQIELLPHPLTRAPPWCFLLILLADTSVEIEQATSQHESTHPEKCDWNGNGRDSIGTALQTLTNA